MTNLMKHTKETHKECEIQNCPICDGDLFSCTVCDGAEGSLTTDCYGSPLTSIELEGVMQGEFDVLDGQKVQLYPGTKRLTNE